MSAPMTHFERTNSLSDLNQELEFLRLVESETNMRLRIIGRTTTGRPIHSCEIGSPNGETFFTVHSQHGGERMTREAGQAFIRDLAYNPTSSQQNFLSNHRVVVVPTANPDGIPGRRRDTAMNVDMNRSWITINQPESTAIKRELNRTTPLVLVDSHEHNPQSSNQMSYFFRADNALISTSHMDTVASHAEDWMLSMLDSEGVTHEPFPSNPNAHQLTLRTHCIANHIYPMLVETIMRRSENNRLDTALTFLHGALRWMDENMSFIRSNMQNSIRDSENRTSKMFIHSKNSSGNFGGVRELTDPRNILIPNGVDIPHQLLSDMGIEIDGRTVPTNQKSRKILGTLLSPDSYYYYRDWPQPPMMPVAGRSKVRIKGSPMEDLYMNLAPDYGV